MLSGVFTCCSSCKNCFVLAIILFPFFQESVGPDNVEGYAKVEALATFLASLRFDPSIALTNQQASCIVDLRQDLEDCDKQMMHFRPQYNCGGGRGGGSKGSIPVSKMGKAPRAEVS